MEGKWHFLTVTLKLTVLSHIFPSPWGGRKAKGRSPTPEKGLQDYSLPKARWWGVPLHFILSSSLASWFCTTQSLWLWSSEVQRHSFTEVAQVLQANCMINSFMTPAKNHTLRLCSLFPRIMQITLLLPWLERNRKTHWVSLCLFTQTSNLLKGCLMLPRETLGCPREIFQPCCSFPCWWATLPEICTLQKKKKPSLLQETSQAPVLLGHFGHDVPLLNFHRARSTFSEVKLCIRSPEHDFQKKSAWMLLVQAPADINREKVSPVLS